MFFSRRATSSWTALLSSWRHFSSSRRVVLFSWKLLICSGKALFSYAKAVSSSWRTFSSFLKTYSCRDFISSLRAFLSLKSFSLLKCIPFILLQDLISPPVIIACLLEGTFFTWRILFSVWDVMSSSQIILLFPWKVWFSPWRNRFKLSGKMVKQKSVLKDKYYFGYTFLILRQHFIHPKNGFYSALWAL